MSARGLLAAVVLAGLVVVGAGYAPPPASAHCPDDGQDRRYYVGGGHVEQAQAARTRIGWTLPVNVCGRPTTYSVSIVSAPGTADAGWVQAGWVYRPGRPRPMGYCERQPRADGTGSYQLTEYPVAQQNQFYAYARNGSGRMECRIDGDLMVSTSIEFLGFGNGSQQPVQAEALERHAQLGRISPAWLPFSSAGMVPWQGSAWTPMTVGYLRSDDPVWHYDRPDNLGFRVNTDAQH